MHSSVQDRARPSEIEQATIRIQAVERGRNSRGKISAQREKRRVMAVQEPNARLVDECLTWGNSSKHGAEGRSPDGHSKKASGTTVALDRKTAEHIAALIDERMMVR